MDTSDCPENIRQFCEEIMKKTKGEQVYKSSPKLKNEALELLNKCLKEQNSPIQMGSLVFTNMFRNREFMTKIIDGNIYFY